MSTQARTPLLLLCLWIVLLLLLLQAQSRPGSVSWQQALILVQALLMLVMQALLVLLEMQLAL